VLQPDEYAKLTDEELMRLVREELSVNEGVADATFQHKRLAEGLERAMYFCPKCGATTFTTKKDVISCKKCGMQVRYTKTKELVGVTEPFPYRFVAEWYDAQSAFMRSLDFAPYKDLPLFTEQSLALSEVILYKKKNPIAKSASIDMFADRFEIAYGNESAVLPFEQVSAVTVLGKNKLNVYFRDTVWQFKSDTMNALKFVNAFYHYKNIQAGNPNGEFLGL
jgi:ribosomal protein S27AE